MTRAGCLVAALSLGALGVFASDIGGPAQPFSADYTTTHSGDKSSGKWYFAPPRMRIDVDSMPQKSANPMGGKVDVIIDTSNQKTYILMPQMHMYMQVQGNGARMDPGMRNLQALTHGACPQGSTCKKSGTESVNGRMCDKYEVTDDSGKHGTAWVDQKLNFPIRYRDEDGALTEFTNIQEGAPDPALFKLPDGYRQFDPRAFARGAQ